MSDLIIVESPAKAKTIGKYLGGKYQVRASMGHLRDLPKNDMGVDIEGGFVPEYRPIAGKEKMIRELKSAAQESDRVYLATDPDREGEAISWHLKELLGLPDQRALRVTFNEITKKVVSESIKAPRAIDMDLVNAQQARRVLDRIVGYKLSPFLWKKIRRGLSAGRVQSVCTRMVVDREEEIRAFKPEEYWSIDLLLRRERDKSAFLAHFVGNEEGKLEIKSGAETQAVLDAISGTNFTVKKVKRGKKQRSPVPPFITSTLQQDASRKLGMVSKRTMAIAQQLYEGVELAELGMTGLITYMRTDSLRISEEAIAQARDFIAARYGKQFCPETPKHYKSGKSAQDAHEAIRPSNVQLTPESLKESLNQDQYRLYKLIWERFVASQMENALYDTLSVDILGGGYLFRATSTSLNFAGFTAVYEEGRDDEGGDKEEKIPPLKEGDRLILVEAKPDQHFTQPPARYNEATLIQAMEKQGVGRPSTYAPTISVIQERDYVRKDGRALMPTPLGEVVTGLMKDKFADIVDVAFTARMEDDLDQIEEGKKDWKQTLAAFYGSFDAELKKAEEDLSGGRIKVPDEETDQVCELCGKKMVIKAGRFGKFLGCAGFPECRNTKPITEETPGECLLCGGKILKKKSKNGYTYFGCENFPKCSFMTWDLPVKERCPECGKSLFRRQGKGRYKPYCINPECAAFLPEDSRGYKKKSADKDGEAAAASENKQAAGKKAAPKKPAAQKSPAKKTTAKTPAKKPASKKPAVQKPAKKTGEDKTGA